jgi:TPR repeat protein
MLLYRLLSSERQLSAAMRSWERGAKAQAIRIARLAARQSIDAKLMLAQWLLYPGGVPELLATDEGVRLLREAASLGSLEALQVLAGCYLNGEGVDPDIDRAVQLLEDAGNGGLLVAWEELVHIFTNGQHVNIDTKRALEYAGKLAVAGHPQMQRTLRAEVLGL